MDVLVTGCAYDMNVTMAPAWMLFESDDCKRYYGLGTDALVFGSVGTRASSCSGHPCSGNRTLLEHDRYYVLSVDALVIVRTWTRKVVMIWAGMLWSSGAIGLIMVWAWMLCSPYALGTRTVIMICCMDAFGSQMGLEHQRYHVLAMAARVVGCART